MPTVISFQARKMGNNRKLCGGTDKRSKLKALSLNDIVVTIFGRRYAVCFRRKSNGANFEALHEVFEIAEDAEITVEANHGTVTQEKLSAYRKLGINRISFGLQSADNGELKLLGRIHTYEQFWKAMRWQERQDSRIST